MTTDAFINKLNAKIALIEKEDNPLRLAVSSVMGLQSQRIFIDGKNASGGNIGDYLKNPVYISLVDSPKSFTPKGKPNSEGGSPKDKNLLVSNIGTRVTKKIKVKQSGGERKTGYFESFLAYKKVIGRNKNIDTIDLFLSGRLHRNWANAEINKPPQAIKINQHNYIVGLSTENAVKVSKSGTDLLRYGNVFGLSVSEKKTFKETIQFELANALR